ncbi:hypothetical protein L6452_10868 [Arctium lappa]|uniref:Uncharacterized protein n=1 Tax=Arctium lappa TaxID=4217 RepID=A0ACB9DP18_ARCLA|nr:hypothetical protein L6452_10868 [Arctium lappa]
MQVHNVILLVPDTYHYEGEEEKSRRSLNLVVKVLNRSILRSEYFLIWIWVEYGFCIAVLDEQGDGRSTGGCSTGWSFDQVVVRPNGCVRPKPVRSRMFERMVVALVKKKETKVSISGGLPGFLERRVLSLEVFGVD